MKDNPSRYSGQCLCGAIQYEVDKLSPRMGHCHCSMCRKFHGSAFATYGEAERKGFRWTRGKSALSAYTAPNDTTRKFCRFCGSSLIFEASDADGSVVELALGTLDSPVSLLPDAHIFVANKANWHTISDDLPQFEAGRNSKLKT